MPLLYPISAVTLFIFYVRDRIMLFYGYKIPPSFDESMTTDAFKILKLLPIASIAILFW